MTVYLIHFTTPYHHARHYLGWTNDLDRRMREHRANMGARLLEVLNNNGITYDVVRTWPEGTPLLERQLKNRHNSRFLCPVCRQAVTTGQRND